MLLYFFSDIIFVGQAKVHLPHQKRPHQMEVSTGPIMQISAMSPITG